MKGRAPAGRSGRERRCPSPETPLATMQRDRGLQRRERDEPQTSGWRRRD